MAAGWRRRVWTPRCWGVYAMPCDDCLPEPPVHRVVDPPRADAARNASTPSAVDGTVWYSVSA